MFYGNMRIRRELTTMQARGRLPQGMIFYGETGLGKKALARWTASLRLCTGSGEKPCGTCLSCRKIAAGKHPDLIEVPHSGKKNGFSVDTARNICNDLAVPPNDGPAKFYFFFDCDAMDDRTQNLLLKAVEEPPEYVHFIFTAQTTDVFLSTIRSRTVAFPLSPVTTEECRAALTEIGFLRSEITEAEGAFHGNIGAARAFLEEEQIQEIFSLTNRFLGAIIKQDSYTMLTAAGDSLLEKSRENAQLFLTQLDLAFRDALCLHFEKGTECLGASPKEAAALAKVAPPVRIAAFHDAVRRAKHSLDANVAIKLVLGAFCADCATEKNRAERI